MPRRIEEAWELAAHILKLDPENHEEIALAIEDKWQVGYDTFEEIANELLDLTMPFRPPLGKGYLKAFVRPDLNAPGVWLALMRARANVTEKQDPQGT